MQADLMSWHKLYLSQTPLRRFLSVLSREDRNRFFKKYFVVFGILDDEQVPKTE
jgi:hypothetical protein